ncbi:MAG: ATP-dependent DNA helicase RecG [Acidimicrobiia bacterium]
MATLARLAGVDVSEVKGLGGQRAAALRKQGVETVADLLHNIPRRYIDRSRKEMIADVIVGVEVTLVGEVRSVNTRRPKKKLAMIEATIADESATIKAIWFNQTFRVKQLQPGTHVALSGVVESFRGNLQMKSPDVDVLDSPTESLVTGRVVPVHPSTASAKPGVMRRAIHNALIRSRPIDDPVPGHLLEAHDLMSRDEAFATIHFPESTDQVRPARTRLVYDEFFRLSIAFALRKRRQESEAAGIEHNPTGELLDRFVGGLPYALTGAQKTVLAEIQRDMRKTQPMHRMLQGEVGSGKTVVAVATMLSAIEGGWQTAIMAPTEVLAEQHFLGVVDLLAQAGLSPDILGMASDLGMDSLFGADGPAVHAALLTGSTATTNYSGRVSRSQLLLDVKSGQVDLLVGTHALIQDGVEFARLGAAVVDEQHRFGVSQRVMLKEKADGAEPDLLIMTATPIPRTIAMSVYGDLDVSTIDEMPPGRTPVRTKLLPRSAEMTAWGVLKKEVEEGRQGFVVCPLVEDSPKVEAVSATAEYERITSLLPGVRVGLIHGQMPSQDKEAAMAAFRDGETDVLVATTVIEVGIDVPNATVMVIEDADRFGLSQLHQLRGRVGRGKHPGVCILLADPTTDEGQERMTAMVESNDGFELANTDLRIRGQGTVFGTRQSGMTDFKIADVLADTDLLHKARRDAFALVESDPELRDHPELATEIRAMLGDRVEWLFVS